MANINFPIEDELHKQFKIRCLEVGKDIKEVLPELINQFIKKEGDTNADVYNKGQ